MPCRSLTCGMYYIVSLFFYFKTRADILLDKYKILSFCQFPVLFFSTLLVPDKTDNSYPCRLSIISEKKRGYQIKANEAARSCYQDLFTIQLIPARIVRSNFLYINKKSTLYIFLNRVFCLRVVFHLYIPQSIILFLLFCSHFLQPFSAAILCSNS